MTKSPVQAVYDTCFLKCQEITNNTYDYLPGSETKYPFIYIGNGNNMYAENMDEYGRVNQTIHIWGTRTQRKELDILLTKIYRELKRIRQAFNYNLVLSGIRTQRIDDNTTGSPLIHQVIECMFDWTRKD